ncbi:hypothetical protein Tco_1138425 [Tanacetum coccineum]
MSFQSVRNIFQDLRTGELHFQILKKDLEGFMGGGGAKIHFSEPFVFFCETVPEKSSCIITNKDRNKRFYMEARPLEDGLEAIDESVPVMTPKPGQTSLIGNLNGEWILP